MKFEKIELKVANMRKPQEFIVYPNGTSKDYIILQSDKRMAILMKDDNTFFVTSKNYNYPNMAHLQVDRVKVELTTKQVEQIRRIYNAASNGKDGKLIITLGGQ